MTYRYEPRLQAFGLEPKACSRYGWEFFLCFVWGFLFFSRASEKKFELRIFRNFYFSGKKSELKEIFEFLFRSGISRSEIEFFPTEEHEGVRIGSGGNPKKTNDDEVKEVSNPSNKSVFFRSEKAEDF